MRLESSIVIRQKTHEVCRFLADPLNVPKWDRGVAAVEVMGEGNPQGIGCEFATLGYSASLPDRGRMDYRVTEAESDGRESCVELISRTGNARFFRAARWRQHVEDVLEGSRVTVVAEFQLRARYLLLAPVLRILGPSALRKDMRSLKRSLENA
jgi:Polyketide cyclase / dehydrase and lipid transport